MLIDWEGKVTQGINVFETLKNRSTIILGNGPGINEFKTEIEEVRKKENPVIFGVNRVFKSDTPVSIYLALDRNPWAMSLEDIWRLNAKIYFCPEKYKEVLEEDPYYYERKRDTRVLFFSLDPDPFNFSKSLSILGHGYTSIYPCLQISSFLCTSRIYLYGVDFNFDVLGRSHFWVQDKKDNMHRGPKSWSLGKKAVEIGLEKLKTLGIDVRLRSNYFKV